MPSAASAYEGFVVRRLVGACLQAILGNPQISRMVSIRSISALCARRLAHFRQHRVDARKQLRKAKGL
jgi:hypothetical protein